MKLAALRCLLTFAIAANVGHARMLLQDSLNVGSRDIPPASNTSLEVPIISYQLGSPASAPAKSPLASLSALTNMLVPALAPVALVSEGVEATGRKLKQADFAVPSPAPAPAPEAICSSVATLLPSSFASLGQTLALAPTLASLPNSNYTLVVPSNEALASAATSLAAISSDPNALQQIISQGLIMGKDLKLQNGDVLMSRLPESPLKVAVDGQGLITLATSVNSAKVLQMEKSCTVDLIIVDTVLLPGGTTSTLG